MRSIPNFDSYYNDNAQDDFEKAMDIVDGDPDKQQRYGHPDDWGSETVSEILDEHRRETEKALADQPESDVYEIARQLYKGGGETDEKSGDVHGC